MYKVINIRKGVFETNSSSTHCLVITKEDNVINMNIENFLNYEDRIAINTQESFGWGFDKYGELSYKLGYIFGCLIDYKKFIETRDLLIEVYNKINELVKETFGYELEQDFIDDIRQIEEPEDPNDYFFLWDDYVCSVDQNYDKRKMILRLLENKSDLKKFLFSEDSYLVTFNDNSTSKEFDKCSSSSDYFGGN